MFKHRSKTNRGTLGKQALQLIVLQFVLQCNLLQYSLLPSLSNLFVSTVVQRFSFLSLSDSLSLTGMCVLCSICSVLLCSALLCSADLRSIYLCRPQVHLSVPTSGPSATGLGPICYLLSICCLYLLFLSAVYLILSLSPFCNVFCK